MLKNMGFKYIYNCMYIAVTRLIPGMMITNIKNNPPIS